MKGMMNSPEIWYKIHGRVLTQNSNGWKYEIILGSYTTIGSTISKVHIACVKTRVRGFYSGKLLNEEKLSYHLPSSRCYIYITI